MEEDVEIPLIRLPSIRLSVRPDIHIPQYLQDAYLSAEQNSPAHKQRYDPNKIPPDFQLAMNHGKANMVYKYTKHRKSESDDEHHEVCPCCGMQIGGEQLPLSCSLDELYHIGSGNILYFILIKYSIALLGLMFFVSGGFNLVSNLIEGDCYTEATTDKVNICTTDYRMLMSIANKRDNSTLLPLQMWLNLAFVFIMMPFFHYIRYQHRKVIQEVNSKRITPADYTVKVSNLSTKIKDEQIQAWIEGFRTPEHPIRCRKIIRAYQIKDFIKYETRKDALLKKLRSSNQSYSSKVIIRKELRYLDLEREVKLNNQREKFTKVAYIIFEDVAMADRVCHIFQKSPARIFLYRVLPCAKRCKIGRKENLKVTRAPEPSDILWTNHAYSKLRRISNRIVTFFGTVLLLVIASLTYVGIFYGQKYVDDLIGDHYVLNEVTSMSASCVIVLVNILLSYAIEWLVSYEKYATKTSYFTKMAEKKSVALLINTAFTSLIAQIILADSYESFDETISAIKNLNIYGKGGLIENIFYTIILNAIYGPLLAYFSIPYLYNLCKRRCALRKGPKAILNQTDANLLFEGPHHHMPYKYSNLIKTMLVTAFYAPAMPIAIIFAMTGLVVSYWVDKYILCRRNSMPIPIDNRMSDSMLEYLELMALTFSAGNLLFFGTLIDSNGNKVFNSLHQILAWITFAISVLYTLIPMDVVNEDWFPIEMKIVKIRTYDEARIGFHTDYDIQNPITRQEAVEELIQTAQRYKKNNKKLQKLFKDEKVNQVFSLMVDQVLFEHEEKENSKEMKPPPQPSALDVPKTPKTPQKKRKMIQHSQN